MELIDTINDTNMYEYFRMIVKNRNTNFEFLKNQDCAQRGLKKNLTSYNLEELYKTLRVIYSDIEAENELYMIDDVLNILDTFICIDGLNNMLVNNYSAIENNIFLEHDAKSGNPKRVREHYKHQFRNAYLASKLLLEYNFLEEIVVSLNKKNCLIAEYITYSIEDYEDKNLKLKQIVFKSIFISALFHDIGYPLEFFFRVSSQIHDYAPFFKIISTNIKTPFIEIKSLLSNSLLFECVNCKDIQAKYESNDHGCLSAISFLLNYYYSGNINNLTKYDRCIIEMSAISIYKHTNKYNDNKRMIFTEDPISYMLRICDDLQEWERFLLLINEKHNYLKCDKCGEIVLLKQKNIYKCNCGAGFTKITEINNKKVNYINICDNLKLYRTNNSILNIEINYDYYKQIEILLDDYTSVLYRDKSNKELLKIFEYQSYSPKIVVSYFLSNNPILLIEKMIEDKKRTDEELMTFISNLPNQLEQDNMNKFISKYKYYIHNKNWEYFGNKLELNELKYKPRSQSFILQYLGQIYNLKEWLS